MYCICNLCCFKELEIKLKNSKLNISVNDAVEYLKNMYQVSFYIPEIARKVATWNSLTPEQEQLIRLLN